MGAFSIQMTVFQYQDEKEHCLMPRELSVEVPFL